MSTIRLDQGQYDRLKHCSDKKDMTEWNQWRKENPEVEIWLEGAELYRANLQGAELYRANLQGAKLSYAELQGAELSYAELQGAKLHYANLQGAMLYYANLQGAELHYAKLQEAELHYAKLQGAELHYAKLQGAELHYAKLQEAELHYAKLQEAELSYAELQGAKLYYANLQGADLTIAFFTGSLFKNTHFSSKAALNNLASPLSDEQILSAVFEDEKDRFKKTEAETRDLASLTISIEGLTQWDLMDFGMFFICLQKTYNNVLYLMTTEDEDIERIKDRISKHDWHPGTENNISLKSVRTGSWIIELIQSNPQYMPFIEFIAIISPVYIVVSRGLTLYEKTLDIRNKRLDIKLKKKNFEKKEQESIPAEKENKQPLMAINQKIHPEIKNAFKKEIEKIDFQGQIKSPTVEKNKVELFSEGAAPMVNISNKLHHAGVEGMNFALKEPKK
ncbi:MAG: pentapeptide repeat-containing protein [Desulfobacteraceae bacterium]|nr:pentapeptide repeat-containing protein [Desulfobacteraceae bacterium]